MLRKTQFFHLSALRSLPNTTSLFFENTRLFISTLDIIKLKILTGHIMPNILIVSVLEVRSYELCPALLFPFIDAGHIQAGPCPLLYGVRITCVWGSTLKAHLDRVVSEALRLYSLPFYLLSSVAPVSFIELGNCMPPPPLRSHYNRLSAEAHPYSVQIP